MPKLFLAFLLLTTMLPAQTVPHATGIAHTEQVDLAYETFGAKGTAIPIIAVNGGPGLSHAYMMQNDLWQRIGKNRFVVLYDQRGTGGSKRMQTGASQSMDAQVADLDAVCQALGLTKFALLGDSYGGLVVMAYAAAHPEHVAKLDTFRFTRAFMAEHRSPAARCLSRYRGREQTGSAKAWPRN